MKTNFTVETCGNGLWSSCERKVKIYEIEIDDSEVQSSEDVVYFKMYFTKKSWDVEKHGLIYTDDKFLREIKKELTKLGIDLTRSQFDYTEQGMQGDNYVSMSAFATKKLINSINKLERELV